jgi:uncharacterized protein YdiU (UPF0061 family)
MQEKMENMWATKLGLRTFNSALFRELEALMIETPVDYTILFRELSMLPEDIGPLKASFYKDSRGTASMHAYEPEPGEMEKRWSEWFIKWKSLLSGAGTTDANAAPPRSREEISRHMKLVNPKYSLREWLLAPVYQQATEGNYSAVRELQEVITQPYAEQSKGVEDRYYQRVPSKMSGVGGISYYSCSS